MLARVKLEDTKVESKEEVRMSMPPSYLDGL